MQPAQEFMQEYLCERTAITTKELELLAPFRRKFYTDDCRRHGHVEKLPQIVKENESEKIVQVSSSETGAEVITGVETHDGDLQRLRYRLEARSESWLIQRVDLECLKCRGTTGNSDCLGCNGNGWILGNRQAGYSDILPRREIQPQSPSRRF